MAKHDHCEHAFKLCTQCDVVHCTKCQKEWGNQHNHRLWYQPWYSGTTTITYPTVITDKLSYADLPLDVITSISDNAIPAGNEVHAHGN